MKIIDMSVIFNNHYVECTMCDYSEKDDDVVININHVIKYVDTLLVEFCITDIELRKLELIIENYAEFSRMFKAIRGAI